MKKVTILFASAILFVIASCGNGGEATAPAVDSLAVDSVAVDSVAVDTAVVDSVKK